MSRLNSYSAQDILSLANGTLNADAVKVLTHAMETGDDAAAYELKAKLGKVKADLNSLLTTLSNVLALTDTAIEYITRQRELDAKKREVTENLYKVTASATGE